jgi:nucleoside-diphosphate-sugar epimerase
LSQVLVTGANGFIGSALCHALVGAGHVPRAAVRRIVPGGKSPESAVGVGEIDGNTDWSKALRGIEYIVHLASPSAPPRGSPADSLAGYRRVNVAGSRRLAEQAAAAGARRLVFMSTIKVNGERTAERAYTENDAPRPEDAYGISKQEAEQALRDVAQKTGLEIVVLRPPIVYGPGVKGNFLRLMNLVARGVPLPLGAVNNRRSFIYTGNLAAAIIKALDAPQAAGRTYLVSDGEDVSTPDLVRGLARALGVKARLLSLPVAALGLGATLAGKRAEFVRLSGSLQVDSSRIRRELDWRPPFTLAQGLEPTAKWYPGRSTDMSH